MSNEKIREEFEVWYWKQNGSSTTLAMEASWQAWQASRAAIEVELPKAPDKYDLAGRVKLVDVVMAIEAIGLRVKS